MGNKVIDIQLFKNWYQKNSRSLLIIIAAGCLCASALFQFISAFTSFSSIKQTLYRYNLSDLYYVIDDMIGVLRGVAVVSAVISLVPTVFKIIGLFFQWFPEANGSLERHQKGLKLINTSVIISMVYICVSYGIMIILTTIASFAIARYTAMGFLVLFIEIGILVVYIYYYKYLMKLCKAFLDGVDGHAHVFTGAMYIIVLLGVMAFFGFVGSCFSGVVAIIKGLFSLAYNILMMLIVISIREDFEKMSNGVQPLNRFAFEGAVSNTAGGMNMNNVQGGKVRVLDGMNPKEMVVPNGMMINVGKNPQKSQLTVDAGFQSVSGVHISVAYMGGSGYYVTDYSTNGTFYQNGARMQKGVQMQVAPQTVLVLANQCRVMLM